VCSVLLGICRITSSSTRLALPRDSVQEPSSVEHAHWIHNVMMSADSIGHYVSTVKTEYSYENKIEKYVFVCANFSI